MLNFQQVSRNYGEVRAVDAVTFELRTGEVFGLVGPNGSGKSTLLKLMLGIIKPSAGQLLINGQTLSEKGWLDFRKTIGFMPERISFYDNLTGGETLRLFARVKGGSVDNITDILDKLHRVSLYLCKQRPWNPQRHQQYTHNYLSHCTSKHFRFFNL
ncbi:copper ABC transporter ATP-binding protein [Candidatus Magnetobacterium bavaricum]|uniref:Copper ABC transporter ATP-binding protein n=1 Tax=Candidatus Magnetobacterium bavaricum TaxID=29290 RepID=A0A0F3GSZ7_9BACT|nr:copper ABC transporter ATP-binding protein [Candidatus Magnetobacterium bavaricum]KJU84960.1 copper ABC transporter ATP-binding protein [Candidatus Magnetobacterium bavaricum]